GRVILSGLFGGILDSAVFVIIGLSPIGAGFVPWPAVPFAILGQTIIKFTMQLVGVFTLRKFIKKDFDRAVERGYVKAQKHTHPPPWYETGLGVFLFLCQIGRVRNDTLLQMDTKIVVF